VVLDELNVAVAEGLLSEQDLQDILDARPEPLHLLVTGRGACERLKEQADLVTEMTEVKHPFQKGLFARKGIDY
jgi:cob(I)alamin adenosyltransferase